MLSGSGLEEAQFRAQSNSPSEQTTENKEVVAAGPVSRILSAARRLQDGHSSGPRITARLWRPTRRFDAPSGHVSTAEATDFLPIWSCSVWGLPCPRHCWRGGALLPHLFTLTSSSRLRRYVFCGTFRLAALGPLSRTLSGTLLCGVRTFLFSVPKAQEAAVRSGCLQPNYTTPGAGFPQAQADKLGGPRFCLFGNPDQKPDSRNRKPGP